MVLGAFGGRRVATGWLRGCVWIFPIANPLAKTLLATLRAVLQRFLNSRRLRRDHVSMRAGVPTLLSATAFSEVKLREQALPP